MNPHPELVKFIQTEAARGRTLQDIVYDLKTAGWDDGLTRTALEWLYGSHINDQLDQFYSRPTNYVNAKKPFKFGLIGILGLVFITFAVIAAFVLLSGGGESNQQVYEKFIRNSLNTSTFTQKFSTSGGEDGITGDANIKTDFSDPTTPKIEMSFDLVVDDNTDKGKVSVTYDILSIEDDVWVRLESAGVELNDEARETYNALAKDGETAEDALLRSFGFGETGSWRPYPHPDYADDLDAPFFDSFVVAVGLDVNTVLGELIIGNLGSKANEAAAEILSSGAYTPNYESVVTENIDGTEYLVFEIALDNEKLVNINDKVAKILGLPDRHTAEDLATIFDSNKDIKIWINPDTYLPLRVVSEDDNLTIEYSDFNKKLDIQPPL